MRATKASKLFLSASLINPTARSVVGSLFRLDNCAKSSVGLAIHNLGYALINEIFGMKGFAVLITVKGDADPVAFVVQPALLQ